MDWTHLLLVGVVFMIGQAVEGYILQPFLLGDKIGLSPVAVVFAVLAGAQLAGFLGMLIALPVAAVIVVLLKHLRENYERSSFYAPSSTLLIQEGNIEQLHVETENTKLDLEVKNSKIQIPRIFQIRNNFKANSLYASTPTGYRTST